LKDADTAGPPPAEAKFYNVALTVEYSLSMALALKRLDTPALKPTGLFQLFGQKTFFARRLS